MKYSKLVLIMMLLLSGCGTLSRFTYDGAGNFNNLISQRSGVYSYNDNIAEYDFDSIVLFHIKVIDRSPRPKEFVFPTVMFRVPCGGPQKLDNVLSSDSQHERSFT